MAYTQAQLDAIEKAIGEGALEIEYGNPTKRVKYRSLDEMIRVRDLIRKDLGITTGTTKRLYFSTCKGTDTDGSSNEQANVA